MTEEEYLDKILIAEAIAEQAVKNLEYVEFEKQKLIDILKDIHQTAYEHGNSVSGHWLEEFTKNALKQFGGNK